MHLRTVLRHSERTTAISSKEAAEDLDRRRARRRSLTLTAQTGSRMTGDVPVQVLDISQGGLLIEVKSTGLSIDDQIDVELPEWGLLKARVAWKSGSFVGCQFSQLVSPAAISAALLRADPLTRELPLSTEHGPAPSSRSRIEPELNFSTAFMSAVVLWGLIGLAVMALTWSILLE